MAICSPEWVVTELSEAPDSKSTLLWRVATCRRTSHC